MAVPVSDQVGSPRESQLLTIRQASRIAALSYWTIYRLMRDGDLPTYDLARKGAKRPCLRTSLVALEGWLAEQRATPPTSR